MCFKDNVSFFRMFNMAFLLTHLVILVACVITYTQVGEIPVYYNIMITEGRAIEVKLLYVSFLLHGIALLFHLVFLIRSQPIVQLTFPKNFTNPYHWYYQFIVDGIAFVGVMLVNGFKQIETVGILIALYSAIIVLCFYQDQYMNRGGQFRPTVSPHTFAIPLYVCMVVFIAFKSTENISGPERINIAIVTSITFFQFGILFIIQKFHINYNNVSDMNDLKDKLRQGTAIENVEEGDELDVNIEDRGEILDLEIAELRRAIKYDLIHYLNSVVFHITVTWIIINLTRNKQVLN